MWVYNDLPKLQLDLLEHNIIALSGEIDDRLLTQAREAFLRLEARDSPDVEIRISSTGGAYLSAMGIYDLIRLYKGKTKGVVYFHAESMACVLLQACTARQLPKHAWLLIHNLKVQGVITLDDMKSAAKMQRHKKEMVERQNGINKILAERACKKVGEIRKISTKGERIYADEALCLNLIDSII